MTIIPAIDIINGKCVRLTHGDYRQQKVYNENPVEVAKQFENAGITRLHMVDLDGARAGTILNLKVLEAVASQTKLLIDFGGGIKKITDVENVFQCRGIHCNHWEPCCKTSGISGRMADGIWR
jgi:phosphoribosylformimino-5-aminoimidazole carboxamide ribotide isomerase